MLVIDVYIVVVAVAIVAGLWRGAGRELVSKNQSLNLNEVI